jgi:hypothetical protein
MYKEVTFDPSCLADFSYYIMLKSGFGAERGRFLTVPLKEWVREAFQVVKSSQLGEVKQKSIKNFLNKFMKESNSASLAMPFDRVAVANDLTHEWLAWQDAQHKFFPFDVIVSDRVGDLYTCCDEAHDDKGKWYVPPTKMIRRVSKDYIDNVMPIIKVSKSIYLVDPFIPIPNNQFIGDLVSAAITFNVKEITIFTGINNPNFLSILNHIMHGTQGNKPKLTVVHSDHSIIHDRYFFSECAAIKSGHGFTIKSQTNELTDFTSLGFASNDEIELVLKRLNAFMKDNPNSVYCIK